MPPANFLTLPTFPPFEDSNQTAPPGSGLVNNAANTYGTGTYLRGVFGILGAHQTNVMDLAYIVLPTGSSATFSLDVAETLATSTIVQSAPAPVVPHNLVYHNATLFAQPDSFGSLITAGAGTDKATFVPSTLGNSVAANTLGSVGVANNIGTTANR